VKFTATDTHGFSTDFYLTIKIRETQPDLRDDRKQMETVYVLENTVFAFTISNDVFFDPAD
jgi:hypothetical protein